MGLFVTGHALPEMLSRDEFPVEFISVLKICMVENGAEKSAVMYHAVSITATLSAYRVRGVSGYTWRRRRRRRRRGGGGTQTETGNGCPGSRSKTSI